MNTIHAIDSLSLGERGYLSAATDLAQYFEAPSEALRWRIAHDYELAGDLGRARVWYQALIAESSKTSSTFVSLAAWRLDEMGDGGSE